MNIMAKCANCGAEIHREVKPKKKRNPMKIWLVVVSTLLVISLATSATFFVLWYQEYADSEQVAQLESSSMISSVPSVVASSEPVSSELIPETKEEFIAKCKTLDYNEFKRAPNENIKQKYFKMTGKITGNQLDYLWIQNNSCSELRGTNNKSWNGIRPSSPNYQGLTYKPSGDGLPLVQTSNTDGNPRLYQGDEVTIYGICTAFRDFVIANQDAYVSLPIIIVYYADLK